MSDPVKLTKARRKALESFGDGKSGAPVHRGIRRDVGRWLWDEGLIAGSNGQRYFNAGWSVCVITDRGRAALEK